MKTPKYATKVTKVSKILAMMLFIFLPFIGFYYGSSYQKSITPCSLNCPINHSNQFSTITTKSTKTVTETDEPKLLLNKKYKDFEIGLFQNHSKQNLDKYTMTLGPLINYQIPENADSISFFGQSSFMLDKLFSIANEKIYVINQKVNRLDVYEANLNPATSATTPYFSLAQIRSLEIPKYKIGLLYFIECENNLCSLKTAFNQENSCEFTLNVTTGAFSTPECRDHIGNLMELEE